MLARRVDQENTVHEQQQAAAGKVLNRSFGPKTPGVRGAKTPFKAGKNDENAFKTGKDGAKTLGGGPKDAKSQFDHSAFVTPAGPRTRAPLGFKTANGKAKAFQTPGPIFNDPLTQKSQAKTLSPRLRRGKVKIHQEVEAKAVEEDDVPDVEYMPPREVPLLDEASDDEGWGPEKDLSYLKGSNYATGFKDIYFNREGEDGLRETERKQKQAEARSDKLFDIMCDKAIEDCMNDIERNMQEELGISPRKPSDSGSKPTERLSSTSSITKPKTKKSAPSTVTARSIASALAQKPSSSNTPSYAAPTATTKARIPSVGLFGRKIREEPGFTGRHETAMAASRSTLGYGKGRAVSHNLRSPIASTFTGGGANRSISAQTAATAGDLSSNAMLASPTPKVKSAAQLLKEFEEEMSGREAERLHLHDDDDVSQSGTAKGMTFDLLEDDADDFQFPVPNAH